MTPEKAKQILQEYRERLGPPMRIPDEYYNRHYMDIPYTYKNKDEETGRMSVDLTHTSWMCEQAIKLIDEGKVEKAMRWLGWINYAMWRCNLMTLNEIRDACKSEGLDSVTL